MDTRDGTIYPDLAAALAAGAGPFATPMKIAPTARQLRYGRIGRNDPCPCGSGHKFKKCCMLPPRVERMATDGRTTL